MKRLITSESVSSGHPDKVSDQISDAILDAYLSQDPTSKVAVETMVKDNTVILGGEVNSKGTINLDDIVRSTVEGIGYTDAEHGFYHKNLTIINLIGKQSPEINSAVELDTEDVTAGDQGFMVGYATNETSTKMPIGMYMSKKLVDYVSTINKFGPDTKAQVTVEEEGENKRIHTILVSTMHNPSVELDEVITTVINAIEMNLMGMDDEVHSLIDENTKIVVNPAGQWNVGGPVSDCGLTGRKIVVDQYGPYCPVGGGAFSGKDPSKVDRSAAYLARYIAKNIVSANLADKCKVEISYMIGRAEPTSLNVDTFGYSDDEVLSELVQNIFPMTPNDIIKELELTNPIYLETARGHFGNDKLSWEQTNKAEELFKSYSQPVS
ncbi:MAG: S-adenosylmethionine synthase [uncultured marine phage]|uniref:methionine adenosyltransferase n=1 Tax=uncultured marine phage TaxID=707152 RepID=A0A8D9C9W4_9VIRU|nr:MAG: S-adenosylmethionine synthase [uncultured marine phage]